MSFCMLVGSMLAALTVTWNDAMQLLSTIIHSTKKVLKWWHLWIGTSCVLVPTLVYSWIVHDGDVSYGRLDSIPPVEVTWYHVLAPAVLLILTRYGIPVSTSFLVLSVFSPAVVLEKMLTKSCLGLVVALCFAFVIWFGLAKLVLKIPNVKKRLTPRVDFWARIAQVCSTALLWSMWLKHDMANIAVFLPRSLPLWMLCFVIIVMIASLGYVFKTDGGRISKLVTSKTNTQFVISATAIDLVYALILWQFKMVNNIPMSTTWVFIGLLIGREIAIRNVLTTKSARKLIPMIIADLAKLVLGAVVSVLLVYWIVGQVETITRLTSGLSVTALGVVGAGAIGVVSLMLWASWVHHRGEAHVEGAPATTESLP